MTDYKQFKDFDAAAAADLTDSDIIPVQIYESSEWINYYITKANLFYRRNRVYTAKTSAPTVNDDSGDGYAAGDIWVDETNDNAYILLDAAAGAAVWHQINSPTEKDWSPAWTNLTVGNGAVTAKYIQTGKIIVAVLVLTFGSTTSISGSVSFTLPATPINDNISPLGTCILRDTGTAQYLASPYYNGANGEIRVNKSDGAYVNQVPLSSSVPHTWTTSDEIHISLTYIAD